MSNIFGYDWYKLDSNLGMLIPIRTPSKWIGYEAHHFVEKHVLKKYPELEVYQKMILVPPDCNRDIQNKTRNFNKRWNIELQDIVLILDKQKEGYYENWRKEK